MASRMASDVVIPTLTLQAEPRPASEATSTVRLRLKKPEKKKKVIWSEGTVDNEEMNKKKSKCCCIYKKPRAFGESSSESEDECENCPGHRQKSGSNGPPPESSHPTST